MINITQLATRGIRIWDSKKEVMLYPFIDTYVDIDTGVEDRDGVKIYEHDIVEAGIVDPDNPELYFVVYNFSTCKFCLAPIEYLESYKQGKFPELVFSFQQKDGHLLKVVGSIYKLSESEIIV